MIYKTNQKQTQSCVQYIDLTAPLTKQTPIFPGDPQFKQQQILSLCNGSNFGLCSLQMSNHAGTHVDYPSHVIKGGKTSSDYGIEYLQSEGVIVQVPLQFKSINKQFVDKLDIKKGDIVLFSTGNKLINKKGPFKSDYVYLQPQGADVLVKQGARIVGIDYVSIDRYDDDKLSVHCLLLKEDILIVEGLDIQNNIQGRCWIVVAPLKLQGADGCPARVFARFDQ